MKLGDGVEWALHCLALLAMLPEGSALTGAALAEFHAVSETYLLKQLQALARAGLVTSTAGRRGGFRLARPAGDITLFDVAMAVEGPEPAFRCREVRRRGPAAVEAAGYTAPCPLHAAMLRAEQAWRESLRSVSLADMAQAIAVQASDEAKLKAEAWLKGVVR